MMMVMEVLGVEFDFDDGCCYCCCYCCCCYFCPQYQGGEDD